MNSFTRVFFVFIFVLFAFAVAKPAEASHSWGGYHWARTVNSFTLKVGDNVSPAWDSYLNTTVSDWTASSVLDLSKVSGASKGNCNPTNGRIEVCSKKYGFNGWLGVAQIWVQNTNHIYQAITKVNDSYYNQPAYNTPAWRNIVMCQEVGHALGLDHQDEIFDNSNLGTCMDYTNDPSTNQHPNAHDYAELETIYGHLDGYNSLISTLTTPSHGVGFDTPNDWGIELRRQGQIAEYMRTLDNGDTLHTYVIFAQ